MQRLWGAGAGLVRRLQHLSQHLGPPLQATRTQVHGHTMQETFRYCLKGQCRDNQFWWNQSYEKAKMVAQLEKFLTT